MKTQTEAQKAQPHPPVNPNANPASPFQDAQSRQESDHSEAINSGRVPKDGVAITPAQQHAPPVPPAPNPQVPPKK